MEHSGNHLKLKHGLLLSDHCSMWQRLVFTHGAVGEILSTLHSMPKPSVDLAAEGFSDHL